MIGILAVSYYASVRAPWNLDRLLPNVPQMNLGLQFVALRRFHITRGDHRYLNFPKLMILWFNPSVGNASARERLATFGQIRLFPLFGGLGRFERLSKV
jgi:hypothetical protein